jgi:hypothetical protein
MRRAAFPHPHRSAILLERGDGIWAVWSLACRQEVTGSWLEAAGAEGPAHLSVACASPLRALQPHEAELSSELAKKFEGSRHR